MLCSRCATPMQLRPQQRTNPVPDELHCSHSGVVYCCHVQSRPVDEFMEDFERQEKAFKEKVAQAKERNAQKKASLHYTIGMFHHQYALESSGGVVDSHVYLELSCSLVLVFLANANTHFKSPHGRFQNPKTKVCRFPQQQSNSAQRQRLAWRQTRNA